MKTKRKYTKRTCGACIFWVPEPKDQDSTGRCRHISGFHMPGLRWLPDNETSKSPIIFFKDEMAKECGDFERRK